MQPSVKRRRPTVFLHRRGGKRRRGGVRDQHAWVIRSIGKANPRSLIGDSCHGWVMRFCCCAFALKVRESESCGTKPKYFGVFRLSSGTISIYLKFSLSE